MECYLMSGDSDYLIRVVVRDVPSLQRFIVDELSKIPGVANIRSSFALKQVKSKPIAAAGARCADLGSASAAGSFGRAHSVNSRAYASTPSGIA